MFIEGTIAYMNRIADSGFGVDMVIQDSECETARRTQPMERQYGTKAKCLEMYYIELKGRILKK